MATYTDKLLLSNPEVGSINWDAPWYRNQFINDAVVAQSMLNNGVVTGGVITSAAGLTFDITGSVVIIDGIEATVVGGNFVLTAAASGETILNWIYVTTLAGTIQVSTTKPIGSYALFGIVECDDTAQVRQADLRQMIQQMYVETVADLASVPLGIGVVHVQSYATASDGGGGVFTYDASRSGENDGGLVFNGWVRQYSGKANVKWFGAVGNGIVDDTAAIQAAIDSGFAVYLPNGTYLIDPSVSLIVQNDTSLTGESKRNAQLLAKHNVAGAVIKRQFGTSGAGNNYVNSVQISTLSVFQNHVYQTAIPSNIQTAIDFRHITRGSIVNCYVGNAKVGLAATLYPNGSKDQMARGTAISIGTLSSSDPDYAGGEVNKIHDCNVVSARYGIGIDELTTPGSAAHSTSVQNCDVQSCKTGIAQESGYNAGTNIMYNVVQDATLPQGSGDSLTYHIKVAGFEISIGGGYFESNPTVLTNDICITSTGTRIRVDPIKHGNTLAKFIADNGTKNVVYSFISDGISQYNYTKIINDLPIKGIKAYVSFDATGAIIKSNNVSTVNRNSVGDFNINWATGVADNDSNIYVNVRSTVSRERRINVITHSSSTTRLETYKILVASGTETLLDGQAHFVAILE